MRLIDADDENAATTALFNGYDTYDLEEIFECYPTIEAEPVKHGNWKLHTHSFYYDNFDESIELAVYITAECSECGRKHPDSHQVFSKHLYAPEYATEYFRFDQEVEEDAALKEFMQSGRKLARFCPDCGAKMDGGNHDRQ